MGAGDRPGALTVGGRVLLACVGWGTLTGALLGIVYVVFGVLLGDSSPFQGGGMVPIGAVYGAVVGFSCSVVLGLGSAVGAVLGGHRADAAASPDSRTVRATRVAFLVTAAVMLVVLAISGGGRDSWFGSWSLALGVVLALALGVWRSGRAARLALGRAPLLRVPDTF